MKRKHSTSAADTEGPLWEVVAADELSNPFEQSVTGPSSWGEQQVTAEAPLLEAHVFFSSARTPAPLASATSPLDTPTEAPDEMPAGSPEHVPTEAFDDLDDMPAEPRERAPIEPPGGDLGEPNLFELPDSGIARVPVTSRSRRSASSRVVMVCEQARESIRRRPDRADWASAGARRADRAAWASAGARRAWAWAGGRAAWASAGARRSKSRRAIGVALVATVALIFVTSILGGTGRTSAPDRRQPAPRTTPKLASTAPGPSAAVTPILPVPRSSMTRGTANAKRARARTRRHERRAPKRAHARARAPRPKVAPAPPPPAVSTSTSPPPTVVTSPPPQPEPSQPPPQESAPPPQSQGGSEFGFEQ